MRRLLCRSYGTASRVPHYYVAHQTIVRQQWKRHDGFHRHFYRALSLTTSRRAGHDYGEAFDITLFDEPTIYALSTAPGKAAIAIIRISGPECAQIYRGLCPNKPLPKPRYASIRTLHDPSSSSKDNDSVLDSEALVLFFPSPKTVTGEDVLELHVHGGPATVKAVLAAIPRCIPSPPASSSSAGAHPTRIRYAEPGEFTRRAFQHGRLDLTQIEALGDTLAATTEQQRRLSIRGASHGALAQQYEGWRTRLLHARAELEALIDFQEDQHLDASPRALAASVAAAVRGLVRALDAHRRNAVRGELLRGGVVVALLGAPNAGKSSLLNRVVGREATIVSREAGTTRDVVEVGVDLDGWLVRLGDMAGLRAATRGGEGESRVTCGDGAVEEDRVGEVEREGIRRAQERALEADVVIVVLSLQPSEPDDIRFHLEPDVIETARQCHDEKRNVIVVANKSDLVSSSGSADSIDARIRATVCATFPSIPASRVFAISCKEAVERPDDTVADANRAIADDPGNIQAFLRGLVAVFRDLTTPVQPSDAIPSSSDDTAAAPADPSVWHESLGASERHRRLLEECLEHLAQFLAAVSSSASEDDLGAAHGQLRSDRTDNADDENDDDAIDVVVAAEALRAAADCLARVSGRGSAGDVEQVLGVVFEKFCVGK